MTEQLYCEYVDKIINGSVKINANEKEGFISQYRSSLEETKGISGVVYVFRSENSVPRLKGCSDILYIGETQHDVWGRYIVKNDTNDYWHVYSYIIQQYGSIFIDVYKTSNRKITEKTFLNQYYQAHIELPPINRKG
jgi:hypothetical protein